MEDQKYLAEIEQALTELGIEKNNPGASTGLKWFSGQNGSIESRSPIDDHIIAGVDLPGPDDYQMVLQTAHEAFKKWQMIPAPRRGEVIRQIGIELRKYKQSLGRLVTYEMGKSLQEGLGEVQEMIDICDYATGLSRQLHGLTMHSERPRHRMYEQYHPMGITGIISAFNFPVAVWSWNAMIAWVCGNVCVWKPSEKVPLSAIACQKIISTVFERNGIPEGVSNLIVGDYRIGEMMTADQRIPLIYATGSTRMGKAVGPAVAARLGRTILELGGNNAIIITPDADRQLALSSALFGAVGTAGQRCTTTRRLIIQESVFDGFADQLKHAYDQLSIGNPLDERNHVGPLIDHEAVEMYSRAVDEIKAQGGIALVEGAVLEGPGYESGCYVKPAIFEVKNHYDIVQKETFAPILYLIRYKDMEEAIKLHNDVPQGLSSAIMTNNLRESELFLSHAGSDCGIANVNIGTSGAEIGGAFGGEKETGGGRESGSDVWKFYMRRQTNTINFGEELPLAQGIRFDIS